MQANKKSNNEGEDTTERAQHHVIKPEPEGGDNCGTFDTNCHDVMATFDELNLREELQRGIYAYGFEKPSPIQQRAILPILQGRDTIGQAQSGTGKTGAFSISILEKLDLSIQDCQAVVVAPTRELVEQIYGVISQLGEYMGVTVHACMGGTRVGDEIRTLKRGVQVVVATPGRLFHMLKIGALRTDYIRMFTLDEADELLSQGFQEQIREIFHFLPESTQVALFSATMPLEVLQLSQSFMREPARILVKKEAVTLEGIKQFYVALDHPDQKLDTLCDLYETVTVVQAIIFVSRRRTAELLAEAMTQRDFTVSAIHGEMSLQERQLLMKEFRAGASRVLIATDVLARGIDVQQVSLVLNYELPRERENYIHRIGRSGRHGRKGVAINFVTPSDAHCLRDIEQFYETEIKELPFNISEYM